MTWIAFLAVAVIVVALVSLIGARPKGGRPVAGTQLMAVGRVIAVAIVLGLIYLAMNR